MKYFAFRLVKGQDLKREIQKFVTEKNISAGCMISIVGSLSHTRLRLAGAKEFYDQAGKVEILSLSGTLSHLGSHLHMAVSDHQGKTIGGHLSDGCTVNTTAEIVLGALPGLEFSRQYDAGTGYEELVITEIKQLQ